MSECLHEKFDARVNVQSIAEVKDGPLVAHLAEITVTCAMCSKAFRFLGAPVGLLYKMPSTGVDGIIMRLPMCPVDEPDPDHQLKGFIYHPDGDTEIVG